MAEEKVPQRKLQIWIDVDDHDFLFATYPRHGGVTRVIRHLVKQHRAKVEVRANRIREAAATVDLNLEIPDERSDSAVDA